LSWVVVTLPGVISAQIRQAGAASTDAPRQPWPSKPLGRAGSPSNGWGRFRAARTGWVRRNGLDELK